MDWNPLIDLDCGSVRITKAAKSAGEVLLRHWQIGVKPEHKDGDPRNFVSQADREAEESIRKSLAETAAGIGTYQFCGEESWKRGDTIDPEQPTVVVDSLDGTSNFLAGVPLFAVSIAVVHLGRVLAGVVLELPSGRLFSAKLGKGAWCDGRLLSVGRRQTLAEASIAFDFPRTSSGRRHVLGMQAECIPEIRGTRTLGSAALALCYIARGGLDAYLNPSLSDWDVAAGALILAEAGGIMTLANGDLWTPQNGPHGIVAVNDFEIHSLMLKSYHRHLPTEE